MNFLLTTAPQKVIFVSILLKHFGGKKMKNNDWLQIPKQYFGESIDINVPSV